MAILVVNSGSTSVKLALVNPTATKQLTHLMIERIGQSGITHETALREAIPSLLDHIDSEIQCVGHRVVHGGQDFASAVKITDDVLHRIETLASLAPLHNPASAEGIRVARLLLPGTPQFAVFDTAFHSTLPRRAAHYAVSTEVAQQFQLRRYGFHGTSHQFVARQAAEYLGEDLRNLRIITCHLGGGCSVCAVEYGRSVETSMGLTPLEGLVMATRCGDIDPGAVLHFLRSGQYTLDEVDHLLNRESGLKGLSGRSGDMRDVEQGAADGDEACRLALQVFCHRVRKYIGAYAATMGGVDAIVFTAGIGQNSASVRHRIAQRLNFLGARLDEDRNRAAVVSDESRVAVLNEEFSRVKLFAVATDETLEIAKQSRDLLQSASPKPRRRIPVAISARHVHLTQDAVEQLFGAGHQLTPLKPLSQPGQFAAHEQVSLVGPKRTLEGVRVLGPVRSKNQVEISRTDEFYLGVDAPVRPSGKVDNTPGLTLIGTEGRQLQLDEGVICAWRHIHMTPEDAQQFGVQDGDIVEVEVGADRPRPLTFGNVLIRVKPSYQLEMHIDTDEGNAAELQPLDEGELRPVLATGRLKVMGRHES